MLIALFLWRPSPLLIMVALLAWPQLRTALRGGDPQQAAYYLTDAETRLGYGLLYLGLAGFLATMCYELHTELGVG